jgi:hypothetical protein
MTMRGEQFKLLALAVLLAAGAGLIWGFAGGWCMSIVSDIASSGQTHEQMLFLQNGTPVVESYVGHHYETRTFRDLDGKKIEVADNSTRNGAQLQGPEYEKKPFAGLRWNERIVYAYNNWNAAKIWYFVHNGELEGHGYFVGYDKAAKATIGYMGQGGFRSDKPPLEQQFAVNGRKLSNRYTYGGTAMVNCYYDRFGEVCHLLADDGLWAIDVKNQTVKLLRKDADLISGATDFKEGLADESAPPELRFMPKILLRKPDRIIALTVEGKEMANYLLPPELREDFLTWFTLRNGTVLVYRNIFGNAELAWLEPGGKVVRREHVGLLESDESEFMKRASISVVVPSPALIAGVAVCYPWAFAECPIDWFYAAALKQAIAKIWPVLLATGIVSVVLACVCYRRQRKYGLPWTGVWTVFVLLFGLPAFFGYLAHRAWPARLPCPHCGQRVPRDRPVCFACKQEFPAPAAKGIEVFA